MDIPQDLLENYILRKRSEYHKGIAALEKRDFHFFEVFGHQMKGNAASFGFETLGRLALHFEIAAKDQDLEALHKLLEELKVFLDSVGK